MKQRSQRAIVVLSAVMLLAAACLSQRVAAQERTGAGRGPAAASGNGVIAFDWQGVADTDLRFNEFFDRDHTVVARFMPQYPYGYAGPIFAENGGGTYCIGQGHYRWGGGGWKQAGSPVLFMNVGGKQVVFDLATVEQSAPLAE
ncbi:MAG: hypothetical protein ACREJB_16735, partial [Planctomycetaceae bacterium]